MVSLNALEHNEYSNNPTTKTDVIYSKRIKSFVNNLEPFKKYKGVDCLDWIIEFHDDLYNELLKYNKDNKQSLSTLESNISAVMRVICIYHNGKDNDLYKMYQNILQDIIKQTKHNEGQNKLNSCEIKKGGLIPFQMILNKQKHLYDAFNKIVEHDIIQTKKSYEINQNLLLISMYSLIPPVRNEIKTLSFIDKLPDDNDTNNYIIVIDGNISLYYGGIKKKHPKLIITDEEIPYELKQIIIQSYTLYPRIHLFTSIIDFPNINMKCAITTLNDRIKNTFNDTKYKVSTNMIRSSYITYHLKKDGLCYNDKLKIVKLMRTSLECMERNYYKIDINDNLDNLVDVPLIYHNEIAEIAKVAEVPKEAYTNHKNIQKRYYDNHKEQVLTQQKLYRTQNKYNENRRKVLYYLNNSTDYINKCRKDTLTKYNIECIDGKYI